MKWIAIEIAITNALLAQLDRATAFKQMFTLNRSAYLVKGRWETSYVEVP